MPDETRTCQNCGTVNDAGTARCVQCSMPLTAYSGQLIDERYQGKLAAKVAALDQRPPTVAALTAFHLVFALFWPLASVIVSISTRAKLNEENTNYVAASFGSIGPILTSITLLPTFVALVIIAWATWTQRPWAWFGTLVSLGGFGVVALMHFSGSPARSIFWLILILVACVKWFQHDVKSWYALD